ncbi:Actin family protein [Leishmania donovani]|uniref:Actin family protein n=1 Tax=Leishmania donovani TaxID=5661 RepID=A0A504WZH3_LEIDO|nr:Actin family protein [Leishmania donovani]
MTGVSASIQSVVVDVGTRNTRVGFSGEEAPRTMLRSCVGLPGTRRPRPTLLQHPFDIATGDAAYNDGGLLSLTYPVRAGHVYDYDALEKLLFYALVEEARVTPDASPFLFLEPADQSRLARERLCELLFESFNIPLAGLLTNTAATLYSSGRTRGLALDSGAGRTCVAAVEEGYTLAHSVRSSSIAGEALTDELFAALRAGGYPLSTAADRDVVEAAKEALCRVSADAKDEEARQVGTHSHPDPADGFILPDQERIFLSSTPTNTYLTYTTAMSAERPTTPTGYSQSNPINVVLGGGSTLFPGTEQRVQREIADIAPKGVRATCVAFPERGAAAWMGASIWGCSSVFPDTCLAKATYDEQGSSVVHLYTQ